MAASCGTTVLATSTFKWNALSLLSCVSCCTLVLVSLSPATADETGAIPAPENHGATISKAGDLYVSAVRTGAGEIFTKHDDNLLDAINRACELAGEGKQGKHALIEILTKGSCGSKQRERGRRHGIVPLSYQTLDFHHNEYQVVAGPSTSKFMYGFCFGRASTINKREPDVKAPRTHVTIRNFRLSGNPKAAFDIYYCDHITIENLDLDIDLDQGKGINFRKGSFLDIRGDIYIRGGSSHGMDIVGSSNVTIGDVTVTHTKEGCGVLLSTNHNVKIGNVFGYKNEPQGSYATMRFANGNANAEVQGVYSRSSGKGIMVSSGEAGWQYRPAEGGWPTPGNHNNVVFKADILRTHGANVFMNAPSSHNEVSYAALREAAKNKGGGLTMIKGPKNRVGENILPPVVIDPSRMETVRINELRFGFNDCSPVGDFDVDRTDKYIRDRSCDGYGYAKPAEAKGSEISWTINGGRGRHQLKWRYHSEHDLSASLYINDALSEKVVFKGARTEAEWQTTAATLENVDKGRKLIKLVATTNDGLPLIDFLEVTGPGVQASLFDLETAEN